jgi:hypothetical protein
MKVLPKKIIRLDDGAEFLLDESTNKYEIWLPFIKGENIGNQYSYEVLMSHKGEFKVADGTEDLLKMKKDWIKSIKGNNGHE